MIRPNTPAAYKLFHDATIALSKIEHAGIKVDKDYLVRTIAHAEVSVGEAEDALKADKVWSLWRRRFASEANLESETQLGEVLFEVLKLPGGVRTGKSGKWATDEHVLSRIDHPWIRNYLKLKKLRKSLGTYLRGILREVDDKGFLHPSYNLASGDDEGGGAVSFRGSASDPNFQNMPIRNPLMSEPIRRAFIFRNIGVEVDFSGVEVKIAACYNHDPALIKYIKDKSTDMHRDMAEQIFMLRRDQVGKKTTRDCSKNMFVFPQFYGSVYFQCAPAMWEAMLTRQFRIENTTQLVIDHLAAKGIRELGDCSPEAVKAGTKKGTFVHHLKQVEDDFWNNRFKVYTAWKKKWWKEYQKRGEFYFHTGFTCSGVLRRNAVLNYAIQGTAFHCLLWTVIEVQKELARRGMSAVFVGQIHDSMLADVPPDELQDFLNIITDVASRRLAEHWKWIIVPMEVEVDVVAKGKSWFDKKPWVKHKGVWMSEADMLAQTQPKGGPF